jgi:hypothetical protein
MRIVLITAALLMAFFAKLYAQKDFVTYDRQTYEYYIKGDYKNLKKTADTMFSQGMDYYFLRIRLGVLAYNKQLYSSALKHFDRALKFNSLDTISNEYIYNSYILSGRNEDAKLFLESIPLSKKNFALKSIGKPGFSDFFVGSSVSLYDAIHFKTTRLYHEAIKNSFSINAGFESYLFRRLKGTFVFTNYRKSGTLFAALDTSGAELKLTQSQLYVRLTGYVLAGWEFSGFGQIAVYSETLPSLQPGNVRSTVSKSAEYVGGVGISKNGWKIRTGANLSFSNFSNSNQIRGEGYFTYLPFGNLNLYLILGGMYQSDLNWGPTYQINTEIGFKVSKFLWIEPGIGNGNSFFYARNMGYVMNNSFQIPAITYYGNIIVLTGKKYSVTLTPYFTENQNYYWNLNTYNRITLPNNNSFGGAIKLIYKIR